MQQGYGNFFYLKIKVIELDGFGNVLEISDVVGIGSGGVHAECAALALYDLPDWSAEQIAAKAMKIAGDKCIYTNHNFEMKKLEW